MVQLHWESPDHSDWGGPQEVSNLSSCSKQGSFQIRPGCLELYPDIFWKTPRLETAQLFLGPRLVCKRGQCSLANSSSLLAVAGVESSPVQSVWQESSHWCYWVSSALRPALSLPFHLPALSVRHRQLTLLPFLEWCSKVISKASLCKDKCLLSAQVSCWGGVIKTSFFLYCSAAFYCSGCISVPYLLNRVVAPVQSHVTKCLELRGHLAFQCGYWMICQCLK